MDTIQTPLNEIIINDIANYGIAKTDLLGYEQSLKKHLSEYLGVERTDILIEGYDTTIEVYTDETISYEQLQKLMKLNHNFCIRGYDANCKVVIELSDTIED